MKKAMLSQPMAGKTDEEIVATREKAIKALEANGYEIVNTLFTDDHKTSVGDSGLNSADVYKIRIPQGVDCGDAYLPENEYAKMNNPSRYWTLQNDDWIVIGECQIDIGRPSDLKDLRSKHCKIISYSDNRFGGLPHWRIGGV